MTSAEINAAEDAILDLLNVGSTHYFPLALAAPFISVLIKFEFHKLRRGIADGTIVPDGMGGFVPAHG